MLFRSLISSNLPYRVPDSRLQRSLAMAPAAQLFGFPHYALDRRLPEKAPGKSDSGEQRQDRSARLEDLIRPAAWNSLRQEVIFPGSGHNGDTEGVEEISPGCPSSRGLPRVFCRINPSLSREARRAKRVSLLVDRARRVIC